MPVAKCSNPESFNDLRPISVTSGVSRLFDRIIMKNSLRQSYCDWFSSNKHGLRKGCSTSIALVTLQNQVGSFDEKVYGYTRIMSIDKT